MNPRAVIGLCAGILVLDGFDAQAIGYVTPSIAREFGVAPAALAGTIAVGLFGLMVGALLLGPVADRFGRKPVLVGSVLAFGMFALLTSLAHGLPVLMILRFLTGLGLGGAMPNAVALTAEFAPQRRRSVAVMSMFAGFSLGAAAGGTLAAQLIPSLGWRAVFVVGGAIPIVLAPVLALLLPESPRWIATGGNVESERVAVGALFVPHRASTTMLLWIAFFTNLLALYFASAWLPTVLAGAGIPLAKAVGISALFQYGGVVGALTLGWPADRYGATRVIGGVLVLAAIGVLTIAHVSAGPLLPVFVAIAGFCVVGGQIGLNALASAIYPTSVRATGVGWALGAGRAGSIVGPLIGGAMLATHQPMSSIFGVIAIPLIVGALVTFMIRRPALGDDSVAAVAPAAAMP